jgi:carboxyl-terminal processing protease
MKKTVCLLLFWIITCNSEAQTNRQIRQLATLGKVWGFLKYYHPAALKGKPDWDKELLRMIPLAEQAKTRKAFDSLLGAWYRSLPAARLSNTPVNREVDSLVSIFTEKDIAQFRISEWLKAELVRLYQYHLPDTSRYITRSYGKHYYDHIIHMEDQHEKPYYPDRPMRLLALFRYWNTIAYFYPHRARIPAWDNVLTGYISQFLQTKDAVQYRYTIRKLIHELPDSHSFIQEPGSLYYFYPFRIDYIKGKYLIGECDDSIAKKWDYRAGDEIIAINGKTCREREKELLKTTTGTNALSLHRNIAQELLKVGDSIVQVSFKRNRQVINKPVALHTWEVYRQIPKAPKPLWQELEKGIWYVRFCKITNADTLRQLFRDISQAKAVIWDMRDYPNFKVTTALYKFFFPEKTMFSENRSAWDFYPGTFIKSPHYFTPDSPADIIYNGTLLVLIDEHTQSLAESVAAVLKLRSNTITMGRQTAGTTGNITWFTLPGGIEVSYTGVGVTGPQQSFRQGHGVQLDIPVALTPDRIVQSKDYILEQAIGYARRYQ